MRRFTCAECATTFYRPSYHRGPDPTYCGPTCRKRASRQRRRQDPAQTAARTCSHTRTRPDVVNGWGRRCIDCGAKVAA